MVTAVADSAKACYIGIQRLFWREEQDALSAHVVLRHAATLYSPPHAPPCVKGHCEGALGNLVE